MRMSLGSAIYPGIKFHDTRMIRLMRVLLHASTTVGGWSARQLHDVLPMSFGLPARRYALSQNRGSDFLPTQNQGPIGARASSRLSSEANEPTWHRPPVCGK